VSKSDEGIWVTGDVEMTGGTLDITAVTQGIEATCYIGEDGSPQNKGGNIYIDGGELNVTVTEGYALFAEDDIEIDKALTIKTPKNAKIIDAQYTEDAVTYEGVTVGRSGEGAKEVEIKKESSGGGGGGSSKGSSSSGGIKIPTGTPTLPVVPAPGTTGGQTPAKKEFADVHPLGHWASADIDYVYANGLMKGISETEFGPEAPLTRAMLVTVLYRIEGEPATNRSIPFSDVDMGAYYANAVSWAKQVGIVMGVTETEFAPDLNISREQIAAIMHRYAEYKGYDVTQGGMLIREFNDYEEISEYALTAMAWTVNSGLLKGKGENSLAPEENATRAETAAILHRFIEGNK
ncbi:MAG: S-layer homology domain-containing protein, partial [Clostridia bacterium]|nr:S-layer homology domain-containing protein [Clostridia bacterium]